MSLKTLKELKQPAECDGDVSSEYQIADRVFFFFFWRSKNQMGTLELKSTIIEMKTSLEEPAGANHQEEEWGDSNTRQTMRHDDQRKQETTESPEKSDTPGLLAGTRECQRGEQSEAGV